MATYSSFAIKYNENNPIYNIPNIINGWTIYNPQKEFARQGLVNLKSEGQNLLRTTTLNENYNEEELKKYLNEIEDIFKYGQEILTSNYYNNK